MTRGVTVSKLSAVVERQKETILEAVSHLAEVNRSKEKENEIKITEKNRRKMIKTRKQLKESVESATKNKNNNSRLL